MKPGGGKRKGSQFERKICVELSEWWSGGERQDIFWRSSQSGGRATQRAKKGKKTAGSYGDITALDPIGRPLLKMFTIELKRGDSHGHPLELIDAPHTNVQRKWEKTLAQAVRSAFDAGSFSWLLIHQRDRRETMVYMDWKLVGKELVRQAVNLVVFQSCMNVEGGGKWRLTYCCVSLDDFLRLVTPEEIIQRTKGMK
jgi:hypothetical protein